MKIKYGLMIAATMAMAAVIIMGCSSPGWLNFTASLADSIKVSFVNETPYRVVTWWGAYNPLDLTKNVQVDDLTLESSQTSQEFTINTTRQIDIAGPDLRKAVTINKPTGIDPNSINDQIEFFDVTDPNSPQSVGVCNPTRFHVGVDYFTGYSIEIHFQQDPTTKEFIVKAISTPPATPTPTPFGQ